MARSGRAARGRGAGAARAGRGARRAFRLRGTDRRAWDRAVRPPSRSRSRGRIRSRNRRRRGSRRSRRTRTPAKPATGVPGAGRRAPSKASARARAGGRGPAREHRVHTAVALSAPGRSAAPDVFVETTRVRFRALSRDDAAAYLDAARTLDRAGAYDVATLGERVVESLDGSFTNVMGLPAEALAPRLARLAPFPGTGAS
ncbi:MAG: Maf family protein [Kiritimatiellae bacterium]|nr:Maf family protein [Kiritimatiellia bacterium]